MRNFTVTEKAGLLDYLFKVLRDTKKTRVRKFLQSKSVSVNGRISTRFDEGLEPGDRVAIQTGHAERPKPPLKFGIQKIYEDDSLIVIDKPSGLLSVATDKIQIRTAIRAVNDYLSEIGNQHFSKSRDHKFKSKKKIFVVHRLDKEASGLLVFAKNEKVKRELQKRWKEVRKKYFAVVEGRPEKESGTLKSCLHENPFLKVYSGPKDGKYSITHYRRLESGGRHSLLEIDLETGRKHQIRVHLSDLGHPVAGDKVYGSRSDPAGRLALHASFLSFKHPVTGKQLEFETPLPPSFKKILSPDPSSHAG